MGHDIEDARFGEVEVVHQLEAPFAINVAKKSGNVAMQTIEPAIGKPNGSNLVAHLKNVPVERRCNVETNKSSLEAAMAENPEADHEES
jgi:hypothetical protein